MSTAYAPVPTILPATITLPQDLVDQRSAASVNVPFATLADAVAYLSASLTTYRGITRPPPYISAGTAAAGDTAFSAVVTPTPTQSYSLAFPDVYTAAAEGKIMYFPIEGLMNDEVITDATVYVTGYSGGGGHAGLPALMPGICVIRRLRSTGAISSLQSGGFVLDTSGGVGAYEATHAITTGAAINQNNTVKNQDYEYFLLVQNEGHTNALAYLDVGGAYLTITGRRFIQ